MSVVGASVGPYRIIDRLGAGGMGEVYLAEDTRLGRKVALKTLTGEWATSDARERLLREARAVARLNHPNIAGIYDVLETGETAHIVMEYVEGETLAELLRRGRLSVSQAVHIGVQLTDALAAAHAQGVVHRDLKPSNIHFTPDGQVKVLDFGLAEMHAASASDQRPYSDVTAIDAGKISGTPAYMAPEQFLGKSAGAESDLYSLGVILFEMLAGRLPFEETDFMGLALKVLTEPPAALTDLNPAIPRELAAVVTRALAKEPQDRYRSAREMNADLNRVATGLKEHPTISIDVIGGDLLYRPWRDKRNIWTAVLMLVAGLAGVLLWQSWRPGGVAPLTDSANPVVAVLPLTNVGSDETVDSISAGIANVLISNLARLPNLGVVSREATLEYRGSDRNPQRAARELGATYIVDGAVQRSGDRVRVTLNLLSAGSNLVAWSGEYDATLNDTFALQRRLAEGVADALRLRLTPSERRQLASLPTENPQAFVDYSQGRALLERPDVAGNLDRAIQVFQRAAKQDPRFGLAQAGLAEAYWAKYRDTRDASWTRAAVAASHEALRLDPNQAEVRISLALIYQGLGRNDEAIAELQRALDVSPNNDTAHRILGDVLATQGKTDAAIEELKKSIALRPNYWRTYSWLGLVYQNIGRYEEAAAAHRRVTELQPDNAFGFTNLGSAQMWAGKTAEALQNLERAIQLAPRATTYSNIGTIHYWDGRFEDAIAAYRKAIELAPTEPVARYNLGDAYRRVGREDEARAEYERALALTRALLEVNPNDVSALSGLALNEAKLGQTAAAVGHANRAAALAPSDLQVRFDSAVVLTIAGRPSDALAALEQAVGLGYSVAIVTKDYDLSPLRSDPRFRRLVEPKK